MRLLRFMYYAYTSTHLGVQRGVVVIYHFAVLLALFSWQLPQYEQTQSTCRFTLSGNDTYYSSYMFKYFCQTKPKA